MIQTDYHNNPNKRAFDLQAKVIILKSGRRIEILPEHLEQRNPMMFNRIANIMVPGRGHPDYDPKTFKDATRQVAYTSEERQWIARRFVDKNKQAIVDRYRKSRHTKPVSKNDPDGMKYADRVGRYSVKWCDDNRIPF
tara:strand:+ start:4240 stop:4653 length:414 start_codon:yes stop_codon:yes gene_type:complete